MLVPCLYPSSQLLLIIWTSKELSTKQATAQATTQATRAHLQDLLANAQKNSIHNIKLLCNGCQVYRSIWKSHKSRPRSGGQKSRIKAACANTFSRISNHGNEIAVAVSPNHEPILQQYHVTVICVALPASINVREKQIIQSQ